jgi:Protein involved in biosynthesis of mitomycin antibiotics/polyketide fumonisin
MKFLLDEKGYALWLSGLDESLREQLRQILFHPGEAGRRCLLDVPVVMDAARWIGRELIDAGVLTSTAVAIQAIAFDKSAEANWKVTWHQDLMFPFAKRVNAAEYEQATLKDGVNFARPPRSVLEDLLAVRVHLDDCDHENGPLRVVPGTHKLGVIPSGEIQNHVAQGKELICTASEGDALLMRPLVLHASSKAVVPRHRRVLHLVYHSGAPISEEWHRVVAPT